MPHDYNPDDPWSGPPDPEDMPRRQHEVPRKAKKKMSGGMKILLILLSMGGIALLLCCGGGIYVVNKVRKGRITDPAEIRELTTQIAKIELPSDFKPTEGLDLEEFPFGLLPAMKLVVYDYRLAESPGMLVLVEADVPTDSEVDPREQLELFLKEADQGDQWELRNVSVLETKEFDVRGKKVPFRFEKGKHSKSGMIHRRVVGLFPGKNGQALLMIQIAEEDYNEDEIIKIIESIE